MSAESPDPQPASVNFDELGESHNGTDEIPLSHLMDLTLPVSIELGRTTMSVQEVLRLGRGSVVQLDRLAGEPIDIFIGDRRFAEGEVVVIGERFGIRLTRIVARRAAAA
jgi:flagellar motor switch protein FliN/FliY